MTYCELFYNGVKNRAEAKEFPRPIIEEWPHSWEKGTLTYRLNNLSPDIPSREKQIRAITVAFRVWQLRIKDLKFKREYDETKKVDINISFQPLAKFSSRGVLAHAFLPGQGEISGDIEINDNWDWVTHTAVGNIGHPPLVPVLIHELGHSLGLRHNVTDKTSIMYPSFNLGEKKNKLNDNDVERIQSRYGKRTLPQRIIDYFRRRRDLGLDFR